MKRENKSNKQIKVFPVDIEEIKTLIKVYNSVNEALLSKSAETQNGEKEKIFSTSNIVGEFAEILACERLGYTQNIASKSDYDCLDAQGKKVQIKSRLLKSGRKNGQDRMGDIKASALANIDYVIVILFNENFEVESAFKINSNMYKKYAALSNGKYRLDLNSSTISKIEQDIIEGNPDVESIKAALEGKAIAIAKTKVAPSQGKIGQYAKTTFETLLTQGKLSAGMVRNLMDVNYCRVNFKTRFAILAEKRSGYKKSRYYASKVPGTQYYITNDWYEANRDYLDAWLVNNRLI